MKKFSSLLLLCASGALMAIAYNASAPPQDLTSPQSLLATEPADIAPTFRVNSPANVTMSLVVEPELREDSTPCFVVLIPGVERRMTSVEPSSVWVLVIRQESTPQAQIAADSYSQTCLINSYSHTAREKGDGGPHGPQLAVSI